MRAYGSAGRSILAVLIIAASSGCDFDVSNAGPIADDALNDIAAGPAIVNGMGRTLSRALGFVSYTGAAVSREIVAAGSQNSLIFGITIKQRAGDLDPGLEETNEHWRLSQQARWVAEDGSRRLREILGERFGSDSLAAQALVYAGFANRLLGENMCDAVIDGGPIEPRSVYFQRAANAFSEALSVAVASGNIRLERAARAGRASVRVPLGDWNGAVADATLVPSSFVYQAIYSSLEVDQYNRIYWANANQPLRAHSVVGTFYEPYFRNTGDLRVRWSTNPAFPRGTQNVPWLFQTKFDRHASPVSLATGREMRLIVAESRLRSGDWEGALAMINALRAESGVAPWVAAGIAETWTMLGRERGIELWLEGRRLGDLFRWKAGNVPGTFDDMTGRDLCFPVGISEVDANPNI